MVSEALPDGIYPHLDDADYFAQDRLGSTDLVKLHNRPADWFYTSRWNPEREIDAEEGAEKLPEHVLQRAEAAGWAKKSAEIIFGSALHALTLEGEAVYESRVCIKPATYPGPKGEPKRWHGAATYCQDWEKERKDKLLLDANADRRVRHMAALIEHHPELGPAMRGGLTEVAVLYTHPSGVKLRAKFDSLLPRYLLDLKSYGGDAKGLTHTQQVLSLVAQRHMDVQRFQYFQARQQMAGLLEAGAVFGASADEVDWLKRVAAVEDWSWCWCFYRRRDDKRGYAPVVKPIIRSHFDVTFESGRRKVDVAIQNYQTFLERFGTEIPWAVIEHAEEPADHMFPAWISAVAEPAYPSGRSEVAA